MSRKWAVEHPEKAREMRRNWYYKNREHAIEMNREWKQKNYKRVRQVSRMWRIENIEKVREFSNKWKKANPDKVRLSRRRVEQRRRARLRNVLSEPYTVNEIYERDKGSCGICHRRVSRNRYHLDHIVPISKGGLDTRENVRVTHPRCNLKKGSKLEEAK